MSKYSKYYDIAFKHGLDTYLAKKRSDGIVCLKIEFFWGGTGIPCMTEKIYWYEYASMSLEEFETRCREFVEWAKTQHPKVEGLIAAAVSLRQPVIKK